MKRHVSKIKRFGASDAPKEVITRISKDTDKIRLRPNLCAREPPRIAPKSAPIGKEVMTTESIVGDK